MLSFPAANWEKARTVMKPSQAAARNSGFGRLASRITPRLYLSDYFTASDPEKLAMHGITHVISVVDFNPSIPSIIERDRILHIPVVDKSDADILQYLDRTTEFILQALEENETNKVLVHCLQGISRSATVVCAYLVATTEKTAIESIAHVQSIRGIVCPNIGFRTQLEQYSPFTRGSEVDAAQRNSSATQEI
ncbi:phosphatases II [Pholiota conissans]|uniref:Phosphatases II n=1 Tax=Pholiota conissans TaxID=109636 RepID=A0A9P5Z5N4_9AGAR|nr:phosphatases II [Pholiota conissans]